MIATQYVITFSLVEAKTVIQSLGYPLLKCPLSAKLFTSYCSRMTIGSRPAIARHSSPRICREWKVQNFGRVYSVVNHDAKSRPPPVDAVTLLMLRPCRWQSLKSWYLIDAFALTTLMTDFKRGNLVSSTKLAKLKH